MNFKIGDVYGDLAEAKINENFKSISDIEGNSDLFWKLQISKIMESDRCNIKSVHNLDLYVYDRLLPGIESWKDYYLFLIEMRTIF